MLSLAGNTILEPGEEIGLRNEYFHILFNELLDELLIQVKYIQGERVKQGQVIGLIGNTGMSGSPHIHFELTSGFNEEARSFPCFFTNIQNAYGESIEIITEEYTMVHVNKK